MRYLIDTGILLRVVNRQAEKHDEVRQAVRSLKAQKHDTVSFFQNRAEFWNVCTRPTIARGGFGLTVEETRQRLEVIERIAPMIPDLPEAYEQWKQLLIDYQVQGVQVHDARMVALMICHGITHVPTLNCDDFARYGQINAVSVAEAIAGATQT